MPRTTRRCSALRTFLLTSLVALLVPFTAFAATHEPIVIDGNLTDLILAVNNNLGADRGGFQVADPLGDTYTQPCAYVNGYDMRAAYVFLDFIDSGGNYLPNNMTLYAGWQTEGIVGDVDGDGSADTFTLGSPGGASGCALSDEAGIGPNESYNVLLDVDCTGGVDDIRIAIKDGQVNRVANNVTTPIPGATFAFNGHGLELRIPNYQDILSGLPFNVDLCDARFRLTANAEFDGPGEDFASPFQLNVPPSLLITKTPPVQDVCAGAPVSWTITVTNDGLCLINDLTVADTLGAGMTFSSSDPPSTGTASIRNWTFVGVNLEPGQSQIITLTAGTASTCQSPTYLNAVTAEGVHLSTCLPEPASIVVRATAQVNCRDLPPCNITGDQTTCVGNQEIYSTNIGAPYTREWSVISDPPGICSIVGGNTGPTVTVSFSGAGDCTIRLTVTDPLNPQICAKVCEYPVTVNSPPPCNIAGDDRTCQGNTETYSTTVGAGYNKQWSVGACGVINGSSTGDQVSVTFNSAGPCTVSLTVSDPNDPTECPHSCEFPVIVAPGPPCQIGGDDRTCVGNTETFTTNVGPGYNKQWSVGACGVLNGSSTGDQVSVTFNSAGPCTVSLTVTDPNDPTECPHTCTWPVLVSNPPPCVINGPQGGPAGERACVGDTLYFSTPNYPAFNVLWSVGPGGCGSIVGPANQGTVAVAYNAAGPCTLSLAVTDPADPEECPGDCEHIVIVDPVPPCDIVGPTEAAVGDTITYTTNVDLGLYDVAWSVTDDPAGACEIVGPIDGASIRIAFNGPGLCTIHLHVTNPGNPDQCFRDCSLEVTVRGGFACPHTIGFWRQQCAQKSGGSTKVCEAGMELLWRCVIDATGVDQWKTGDDTYETTDALGALSNGALFDRLCAQLQGPRPMTLRDMTELQYLGLMLNVCSGALPLDTPIDNGFDGNVAGAIARIENALNTDTNLGFWEKVADDINNRIGVLAQECPGGDDLFRNLPPCGASSPGQSQLLGLEGANSPEILQTRPFPNPISDRSTAIFYTVPSRLDGAHVSITIFSVAGRVVRTLLSEPKNAGGYSVDWDLTDDAGTGVTSGIYFYQLNVAGEAVTQKLMVLRR